MNIVVLDTSVYGALKVGYQQAVNVIRKAQQILIPAIVLGELLGGFEYGRFRDENRTELRGLLQSNRVLPIPITTTTAERYAVIYAYLRSIGRPIPTNDLWIAAATMEHGAVLLAADKHYTFIPHIIVELIVRNSET